jgi:putative addiction module component (TIGR02574 family)
MADDLLYYSQYFIPKFNSMIQLQEILDLSEAERILIMEKIWDSIDNKNLELPDEHKEELDRRLRRYERGETSFISWDEIRKELASYKK